MRGMYVHTSIVINIIVYLLPYKDRNIKWLIKMNNVFTYKWHRNKSSYGFVVFKIFTDTKHGFIFKFIF